MDSELLDEYLGQVGNFPTPGDLETPFSNFSAVNVVPNPRDMLLINALVSERNNQLAALEDQMANIDGAILKLAAIRARLQQNSDQVRQSLLFHQAITSAARRIPPEVWSEVFYHCLPKTPYIIPRNSQSPLILTRVCRDWRVVAMSTPSLWSSFTIYLQKFACDGYYRHACEAWLARARTIPLSIRIFNDMWVDDPPLLSAAVLWLRPLITRCCDLWWHGPSLPTLFIPETGTEVHLPLERIHITAHLDCPSIYFPGPAKLLHSASLQCLNYNVQSLDGIRLPWDNLVELNMHFALVSSTVFIQILTHCCHLQSLILTCLSADETQYGALRALAPGSITHPNLHRIEIKVIRAGLDAILNALTLPALEELDVCFCYREREAWPHAPFMEMTRRSRCALKRLTVRSNKNAESYFGEYMEAIPGLTIFTSITDPDPWIFR